MPTLREMGSALSESRAGCILSELIRKGRIEPVAVEEGYDGQERPTAPRKHAQRLKGALKKARYMKSLRGARALFV